MLKAMIEARAAELAVPSPPTALDTLQGILDQLQLAAATLDMATYDAAVLALHRRNGLAGTRKIGRGADHGMSRGGDAAGGQRGVRKQVDIHSSSEWIILQRPYCHTFRGMTIVCRTGAETTMKTRRQERISGAASLRAGDQAPEFTHTAPDGQSVSLAASIPATVALIFGSQLLATARRRVQASRLVLGLS